ncbi:MAG TPA: DUF559 domain-containing protein, partial [Actinotalea sp.]|nr:DUF559 domain-containing protein [Actinotalea sp.]
QFTTSVDGKTVRLDMAWPDRMLCIELDGLAFHGPAQRSNDYTRHLALEFAGWWVMRFTWQQVVEHPAWVIAQIRTALQRRA